MFASGNFFDCVFGAVVGLGSSVNLTEMFRADLFYCPVVKKVVFLSFSPVGRTTRARPFCGCWDGSKFSKEFRRECLAIHFVALL